MHEINLRSVDLNLLTVFEAVYEEQSQVKAAERLGMTQPAISHALGRLRHLVGDRLFQGRAKGLTPTGQADDFYRRVHQALELIRAELAERSIFDPATSQRTFVVALDYGGGALLGVKLFQRISALAPHIRLVLRSIDPGEEIPGLLREHRVDLAFNASRFKDDVLEQPMTWKTRLRVVVRKDHPRIKANPTMDELLAERMVVANVSTIRTVDPAHRWLRDQFQAVMESLMEAGQDEFSGYAG
jgi:DNA-binding transcriptional LysR family regulator